ncbi:MAG: hypothetical protein E2P02_02340 [Acidobacteria bacterium]|nr:MAG: hypothetical protein E2P02_02340 [Acidobacteriota bacterium]
MPTNARNPMRKSLTQGCLDPSRLRWQCPDAWFDFENTLEIPPKIGVENQSTAIQALKFGLHCKGVGQNVFVRGLRGGARLKLVAELVRQFGSRTCETLEYAFVHNFAAPDAPRLLSLPSGTGQTFQRGVRDLCEFILNGLSEALASSAVHSRVDAIREEAKAAVERATVELESSLSEASLELVSISENGVEHAAVRPVIDGSPVSREDLAHLQSSGKIDEQRYQQFLADLETFQPRVREVIGHVGLILRQSAAKQRGISEGPARWVLHEAVADIRREFTSEDVGRFVDELINDVVENRVRGTSVESFDAHSCYGVHLLEDWTTRDAFPVVTENHPSLANLVGSVDASREPASAHFSIQAGSLLRANGGCLILDARELRSEPNSWKVLVRTLASGMLEILPPELSASSLPSAIKPGAIPIDVRIVLVGDHKIYRELDEKEGVFSELFKVLADFDSTVDRARDGAYLYAGVLSRLNRDEQYIPFDASAVAALVEQGARLADRPGRLTTHFAKIEDTAREGAFIAESKAETVARRGHIEEAIRTARNRADLPARRYRALLKGGTYNVQTRGWVPGQVNGLAVIKAGQIAYGFPARLTVSSGAGDQGIINIESRASLSGNIHTKGMHILEGLVRHLLRADFPLTFTASLAFEQSYGNIDGDSASGAEICCLISSLADTPIDQGLAITGAIDQRGRIQAVGGVNDKVEGFFDACFDAGLTGEQGVIIPAANVPDLMLREDILEHCKDGQFRVIAVEWVQEALEILTGVTAGEWEPEAKRLTPDSVLARARAKAKQYWMQSMRGRGAAPGSSRADREDSAAKS